MSAYFCAVVLAFMDFFIKDRPPLTEGFAKCSGMGESVRDVLRLLPLVTPQGRLENSPI